MIHCPELREDPERLKLLELSMLLCKINVPFEYGITRDQQMKIGLRIINNLI